MLIISINLIIRRSRDSDMFTVQRGVDASLGGQKTLGICVMDSCT